MIERKYFLQKPPRISVAGARGRRVTGGSKIPVAYLLRGRRGPELRKYISGRIARRIDHFHQHLHLADARTPDSGDFPRCRRMEDIIGIQENDYIAMRLRKTGVAGTKLATILLKHSGD